MARAQAEMGAHSTLHERLRQELYRSLRYCSISIKLRCRSFVLFLVFVAHIRPANYYFAMATIKVILPGGRQLERDQFALHCQRQLATICQLLHLGRQVVELIGELAHL